MSEPDAEISVGTDGVKLKGAPVAEVLPVVRRSARIADRVLRLLDNVVGLPVDYISNNLERFRAKYSERLEEIPPEYRREPPLRVGCAVLKNVAYSAEEPDIQELFANLLASASDSRETMVHPGFAGVIGEMEALEAKLIVEFANGPRQIDLARVRPGIGETNAISRAISNLVRLGLLDWQDKIYDERELQRFVGKQQYSPIRPEELGRLILPLVNDVQKLKNELMDELRRQHLRRRLEVTAFGRNFVSVVATKRQQRAGDSSAGGMAQEARPPASE